MGRAGRDGKPSLIILFFDRKEDVRLLRSFINGSRPTIQRYEKVIDLLKESMLGFDQIIRKANLPKKQVRVILSDLMDQGIINELSLGRIRQYEYRYDSAEISTVKFKEQRSHKQKELKDMIGYTEIVTCRMKYLCDYLGDKLYSDCGKCDNDSGKKIEIKITGLWEKKLNSFRENFFPLLEVEEEDSNIVNGVAASYYGVTKVGRTIQKCKYWIKVDYPDKLIFLVIKAFRKYFDKETFDLCLFVPPTESGTLVRNFAQKLSSVLRIPFSEDLIKVKKTRPQKMLNTILLKKENVADAFDIKNPAKIEGKNILLVDDVYDSGATVKEIGRLLTEKGAAKIVPLVIARTVGGD
jgi:ATP-dependent DNA helicase RecQ